MCTVRIAETRDASELMELNQIYNGANHLTSGVKLVAESIDKNTSELIYVAERKGELIGFVCIQFLRSFAYCRQSIELTDIFVKEEFRNNGVGKALLNKVTEYCEFNNALELILRVNKSNVIAISFYESCGLAEANHSIYRIKYYE